MKNQVLIFLILISFIGVSGQNTKVLANQNNNYIKLKTFNGDTLGYVQHNFIDNKQKYVGKDLNNLLKDEEIPVKSFLPSSTPDIPNISPALYLEFYPRAQFTAKLYRSEKPVDIIVIWASPIPLDSAQNLWSKSKGEWTDIERKYLGTIIIGDILTTKHDQ